jgi:hypothetical protein
MRAKERYPHLWQFMGYFHQDFLDDYESPDAAIAAFISEHTPDEIRAVCRELDEVIPLMEQMEDPHKFFSVDLGCEYYTRADGLTEVEWLRHVRKQLGCDQLSEPVQKAPLGLMD